MNTTSTSQTKSQRGRIPAQVVVAKQEAAPPFRPAVLSLIPSDDPHGDAIAHIPMNDGRTITEHEEKLAALLALAWNTHADILEAAKAMLEYLQRQSTPPIGVEMGRLIGAMSAAIARAEGRA